MRDKGGAGENETSQKKANAKTAFAHRTKNRRGEIDSRADGALRLPSGQRVPHHGPTIIDRAYHRHTCFGPRSRHNLIERTRVEWGIFSRQIVPDAQVLVPIGLDN